MAKPPPKKLRLTVVSPAPSPSKEAGDLAVEMAAAVEQFEAQMASEPGRPVALEETGLDQAEVDTLLSEGLTLPQLRAMGRRLRAEGREQKIEVYRQLLNASRAHGLAQPVDALDLDPLTLVDLSLIHI